MRPGAGQVFVGAGFGGEHGGDVGRVAGRTVAAGAPLRANSRTGGAGAACVPWPAARSGGPTVPRSMARAPSAKSLKVALLVTAARSRREVSRCSPRGGPLARRRPERLIEYH